MLKPWRVTIDTNPDQCNLKCTMCDTHSIHNKNFKPTRKDMDEKLLIKVLNEAISNGVKEIIPTTMGEPLLYRHFNIFTDKISKSSAKLNLTTNGTFPKNSVTYWAKKLLPILSDIKISINSVDPKINEKIMVKDDTDKKLKDIVKFAKLRDELYPKVSITLQVTFLKSNIDYLEEVIKFAISNNINRVKGHHLWITYDEIEKESLLDTQNTINKWNIFIDRVSKYKDKINLVNFEKLEPKNENNTIPDNYDCPFLANELWVSHNGDFNVCCAPSEKRKTLGDWGNIDNKTIDSLFNSTKYLDLQQNYKQQDICKVCTLRKKL